MQTETTILKSKAMFSDYRKHRLFLRHEWNADKKSTMIIMINPNTADTLRMDMTTMLVLNNLSSLGFGSVNIVNLYSKIMPKLSLRFNSDDDLIADKSDEIIEQYAAMSDAIIIAWGSIGNNSQRVRERQADVLDVLKPYENKLYKIGEGSYHPLTPAVSDRALMLSCLPCFKDSEQEAIRQFCLSHRGRIYDNPMHKFLHEIRGEYPGFACEMIGEDLLKGYFVAPFKDNERMKLQNGLFYIFGLDKEELDNKLDLVRIVICKDSKKAVLKDLEMMNISNSYLYSGVERSAMHIKGKRANWINK